MSETRRFERAYRELGAVAGAAAQLARRVLASRRPLYATPRIDAELGDRARANLARAIAHWRSVG
jgi:hypothetical protein